MVAGNAFSVLILGDKQDKQDLSVTESVWHAVFEHDMSHASLCSARARYMSPRVGGSDRAQVALPRTWGPPVCWGLDP